MVAAITVATGVVRTLAAPAISVPRSSVSAAADAVRGDDTGDGAPDAGTAPASALYVHVAGAVAFPGLYRLPAAARVVDAVAAAGGFGPDADPAGVNLARTVSDGEQLVVPRIGEAPPASGDAPAGAAPPADGVIDLNAADAAALDTLPRIGPALAERILQWREENGRFTSVDDLLAVPGIGEKLLAGLRDRVRV